MATMHTQQWQGTKLRVTYGHLYQSRFKSSPVESDEHSYAVVRYLERNASQPVLVQRGEDSPWGSLHQQRGKGDGPPLGDWQLPQFSDSTKYANTPQTEAELEAIRERNNRC
ncbi:MAG: hypothetical protein ACOX1P_23515 [Thermoguttaceae bacterium]|jgi:hypothetical protein